MKSFHYLYTQIINLKDMQDVNRLKIVLVEQKKTSKWWGSRNFLCQSESNFV